jgi:hypothetical protein
VNESGGRKIIWLKRQNVRYRLKQRTVTSACGVLSHASMKWVWSDTTAVSVRHRRPVAQAKGLTVLYGSNTEIGVSNPARSIDRTVQIHVLLCCLVSQRAYPPAKESYHILVSKGLILDFRSHRRAKEEKRVSMVLFRHDLHYHTFFDICIGSEGTELFYRKLKISVRPPLFDQVYSIVTWRQKARIVHCYATAR